MKPDMYRVKATHDEDSIEFYVRDEIGVSLHKIYNAALRAGADALGIATCNVAVNIEPAGAEAEKYWPAHVWFKEPLQEDENGSEG